MIEIVVVIGVVTLTYFLFFRKKDKKTDVKEDINVRYFYTQFELELILKINAYRRSLGLSSLIMNDYISSLCIDHNANMEKQGEASHNGFSDRGQRVIDNLGAIDVGENVAYNYLSADATLKAWIKSPEHKKNLENPHWNIMGLSNLNKYTTNIFAKRA